MAGPPKAKGRWQVSERGGCQPRWSKDGKELFYVEGDALMAVTVRTNGEFQLRPAERLLADPVLDGITWDYDVTPDGHFVMAEQTVAKGKERKKSAVRIVLAAGLGPTPPPKGRCKRSFANSC